MHSYRDGVLGTRGAYILFPGTGATETVFVRVPTNPGVPPAVPFPGVGAFQLSPRIQASQEAVLEAFIASAFRFFSSGKTYVEERGLS